MIDEPGCPRCKRGNFPNMPGELCDECKEKLEKLRKQPKIKGMIGWLRWEASRLQLKTLGRRKYIIDTAKPTKAEISRHTHPRSKRQT